MKALSMTSWARGGSRTEGSPWNEEKIRPIDDFSESFVNATLDAPENITLMSVDGLVAVSKLWARMIKSGRDNELALESGRSSGTHADYKAKERMRLWGNASTSHLLQAVRSLGRRRRLLGHRRAAA